jgi:hypothetical protein
MYSSDTNESINYTPYKGINNNNNSSSLHNLSIANTTVSNFFSPIDQHVGNHSANSSFLLDADSDIDMNHDFSLIKRPPVSNRKLRHLDSDTESDVDEHMKNHLDNSSSSRAMNLSRKTPRKANQFKANLSAEFDSFHSNHESAVDNSINNSCNTSVSASPAKYHPIIQIPSANNSNIPSPFADFKSSDFLSPTATILRHSIPFPSIQQNNNINNDSNTINDSFELTPPNSEPQSPIHSSPLSLFSPDPKAFQSSGKLQLKKKADSQHYLMCPPTPARLKKPQRIVRQSSVFDNKLLGLNTLLAGMQPKQFRKEFTLTDFLLPRYI